MQLKIAGKPAQFDWGHAAQAGIGVAIVIGIELQKLPSLSAHLLSGLTLTVTILGLIYRSIFNQEPPKPPSTVDTVPPKDPNPAFRDIRSLRLALLLSPIFAACSTSWWQNIQKDPTSALRKLIQYVTIFLDNARAIWAVLSPILPASLRTQADMQINTLISAVTDTEAAGTEALKAAELLKQDTPDLSAAIDAIKKAVGKLTDAVWLYAKDRKPQLTAALPVDSDDRLASFDKQSLTIKSW